LFLSLSGLAVAVLKSYLSKLHPSVANGVLFTVLIVVETIGRLLGSMVLGIVYAETVATVPGSAFFVVAGLYSITGITVAAVLFQNPKKHKTYEMEPEVNLACNSEGGALDAQDEDTNSVVKFKSHNEDVMLKGGNIIND
jgi:hypothetical protein